MKKMLYVPLALLQLSAFGQAVPNGSFENWNTTPYNEPAGWITSNLKDLQTNGTPSVSMVSGFKGGNAIRIETNIKDGNASESYLVNTAKHCGDPSTWSGGVPYTEKPTAIKGYYRYYLPANDTAVMVIIFRRKGKHKGENVIKIKGTGSQKFFTPFCFPLWVKGKPDSVIIAISSSNKISNKGIENGSFIELDKLAFVDADQALPEGDFESWTDENFELPAGWNSWGGGAVKALAGVDGSFAVNLKTVEGCEGKEGVVASGITTGIVTRYSGPAGGLPYFMPSDTLYGFYKYAPSGNDSALVNISLSKNGTIVGGGSLALPAATKFTFFKVAFSAGSSPDTMRVDISSSKNPVAANLGSSLLLDKLYLRSQTLGMSEASTLSARIYPNPVKDILYIQPGAAISGTLQLRVYDAIGNEVMGTLSVPRSRIGMDMSGLSPGMYFLEMISGEGKLVSRFVKE